MLQEVDFKDQGLSCIVDSDGTVIVSATDEAPFSALNDIFQSVTAEKKEAAIQAQVLEDIKERRPGIAHFQDLGGEPLIFSYDFLEVNDWMLLTRFP